MNSPMSVISLYHLREHSLFTDVVVSTLTAPSPPLCGQRLMVLSAGMSQDLYQLSHVCKFLFCSNLLNSVRCQLNTGGMYNQSCPPWQVNSLSLSLSAPINPSTPSTKQSGVLLMENNL